METYKIILFLVAMAIGIMIILFPKFKIKLPKKNFFSSGNKTNFWGIFWKIVTTAVIIFAAVMLFIFVSSIFRGCNKKTIPEKIRPAATSSTTVVGKQKTFYRFSDYPDGKVTVYIGSEATWYPVGGEIKIKTSSGRTHTLKPGEQIIFPMEPPGEFTFSANEKSATGIDVWQ